MCACWAHRRKQLVIVFSKALQGRWIYWCWTSDWKETVLFCFHTPMWYNNNKNHLALVSVPWGGRIFKPLDFPEWKGSLVVHGRLWWFMLMRWLLVDLLIFMTNRWLRIGAGNATKINQGFKATTSLPLGRESQATDWVQIHSQWLNQPCLGYQTSIKISGKWNLGKVPEGEHNNVTRG